MYASEPRGTPHRALARGALVVALAVLASSARALPIATLPTADSAPVPESDITLSTCPPRCDAESYARAHPSVVYKPVQPEEIVFDEDVHVIWGDAAGANWTIWGRTGEPTITVWDDSMWVEDADIRIVDRAVGPTSPYSISRENRILAPRSADAQEVRIRGRAPAEAPPPELARLDEMPSDLLTPTPRSRFAEILERVSRSRYAVGAVTLLVVVLMARLAR